MLALYREMAPPPSRRESLPVPKQKDDNSSIWSIMWSILKESLGKDLTHITLPFFFNEPLSVLQKTMEDLEYATLLNKVKLPFQLPQPFISAGCLHACMHSDVHALTFSKGMHAHTFTKASLVGTRWLAMLCRTNAVV